MLRTLWGNHERFKQTYFGNYPGHYFSGDGAKRDAEGRWRIIGRVGDVINVSGHRFGTAEIESAINLSDLVVESAVVGYPHDIKGQGIYAYVITADPLDPDDKAAVDKITGEIVESIVANIGRIAKPDKIQFVKGLPKTRSGKIMRRILRKIAEGEMQNLGDTTTLLDPNVVEDIKAGRV
jgi:acetyl-CoA synthetase